MDFRGIFQPAICDRLIVGWVVFLGKSQKSPKKTSPAVPFQMMSTRLSFMPAPKIVEEWKDHRIER